MYAYNKLERSLWQAFSASAEGLWARPGAHPRVEHLKDSSFG